MENIRKIIFDQILQSVSALAFTVKKGQYLRVIDIEGKQVGDLAIFNEHDHTEKLNTAYTRSNAGKPSEGGKSLFRELQMYFRLQGVTAGHKVMSSVRRPMMTITADTPVPGGIHDLCQKTCTNYAYEREEDREPKHPYPEMGCLELLEEVLKPYDIAKGNIPNTFNIFMNVPYDVNSGMFICIEPVSRPGDYIEFKAEMDCLCGLTACPMGSCAPPSVGIAKPLQVQILED
jgi:uncharacterized protein YcgI (DUF1989 family)